jgi:hypothetical protein
VKTVEDAIAFLQEAGETRDLLMAAVKALDELGAPKRVMGHEPMDLTPAGRIRMLVKQLKSNEPKITPP